MIRGQGACGSSHTKKCHINMVVITMRSNGNLPLGHNALLFHEKGQFNGSFMLPVRERLGIIRNGESVGSSGTWPASYALVV